MPPSRKVVEPVLAAGCPVYLGDDALDALEAWCAGLGPAQRFFILGDERTMRHCLPELLGRVPALREADTLSIPAGEQSKSLAVCQGIWEHLARQAAERSAVLVCLGGGVVTDVGGFVASAYKRGIRVVHVPTSLMGMVDAAIGGKNGVDLMGIKNMVGTVRPPEAVYVHVPFLRTLGKRELLNGVAEMLKHGAIGDADHFNAVCEAPLHDLQALAPLIARSAAIKCEIVDGDPNEQGQRRLLNFGHTIGHALEALSFEGARRVVSHGEAVAAGMVCAAWLSWRMDRLSREELDLLTNVILERFPAYHLEGSDHHRLLALMANDKKNTEGRFRFTLLQRIGEGVIDQEVHAAQVIDALEHYRLLVRDEPHHHS
ncbi:MAG: 3-dehydroquinate synthase [Flavobacteriales bacterium]|nr:3-dehydroquinate synthase [Flavobacteriales bacterium]